MTFLKQGELICKKPSNNLKATQWMSELPSILDAGGGEGRCQPLTFFPQIFPLEGRHLNARGPGTPWSRVPIPALPLAA